MPTPRVVSSALLRASILSIARTPRQCRPPPLSRARVTSSATRIPSPRFYAQDAAPNKKYTFEEVQDLSRGLAAAAAAASAAPPARMLIDTREAAELQRTGTIPGALHVPVVSGPDSWHVGDAEFAERHGFARPGRAVELVFFCQAGVRSRAAAALARHAGWERVGEYEGSWNDWARRTGGGGG